MKADQLEKIPESDDIVLQVQRLKMGLISRATGNGMDPNEYSRLRKIVLGIPGIEEIIPMFLKLCRTSDDFWAWIKKEKRTYEERRELISEALNPILDAVEYESGEGVLEFKKLYKEIRILGQGGFGLVYLYKHLLLDLQFAVKIFAPSFYKGGDKELERFFQEAKMLFKLHHPSIIRIYDAGLIGTRPFIRMEYFEGRNLNEILIKHGTISPLKALDMMKVLVDAMKYAHESAGIIHRDLKPSNIMAMYPNQFRIIDFGLSIYIENELYSRITKTGEATISGYYNAPELVQNPKLVDKRSDIYSLGAIWFTMLTGHPPAGTSLNQQLMSIQGINTDYIACIMKCLASIDFRFADCIQLLEELKRLK
ncbi:serine/threonine-protein kinase [Chitinophaga sp.]|uniref:serine/threonine-protein kinase n=1 Tax=Chitinophaga sp. TaxID=1869181 RepID=UPI0031D62B07